MSDHARIGDDDPRAAGGTDGSASAVRVVTRDGSRFAVVDADERTTLPALLDAAEAARSDADVGIVVRAPAADADAIRRLVDELEDAAFERVDAEVVETAAGDQHRSYLAADGGS
ncbi:MAG: hypothetical protein V5A31_02900 [Haloferacaceae archaeon]|jgi:hypothetical protein